MKLNANDNVWVRLTPTGEEMWASYWRELPGEVGVPGCIRRSVTERDGRVRFQIHELMHIFGKAMYNGNPHLPFENNAIWTEHDSR